MTFPKGSGFLIPATEGTRAPWADPIGDAPYNLGSAILRVPTTTGGGGEFDPECVNQRLVIDNFGTTGIRTVGQLAMPNQETKWSAPIAVSAQYVTNGVWYPKGNAVTHALSFPGVDMGGGIHRISPFLPYLGTNELPPPIAVTFTAPTSQTGGLSISDNFFNVLNPEPGVTYYFQSRGTASMPQFVAWVNDGGVYSPTLTGAGSVTAGGKGELPGSTGDYTALTGTQGVLNMASTGAWGIALYNSLYSTEAPRGSVVNRDIVTVRFIFQFNRLIDGAGYVAFRVGDTTFTVSPSATYSPSQRGYIQISNLGGGTATEPTTDLVPNQFYNAEVDINLVSGVVGGRIYAVGDSATDFLTTSSGGERARDGTYRPTIHIDMMNQDTDLPWRTTFDQIEADVATTGDYPYGYANGANLFRVIKGATGNSPDAYGAHRSWPTSDPGDGRAYAVAWSSLVENRGPVNSPRTSVGAVWGLFGDYGPGVLLDYNVFVSSHSYPATEPAELGGGPFQPDKWDVFVKGEAAFWVGGESLSGSSMTATFALKSHNFGSDPPYWYDYGALGGAEMYFTLTAKGNRGTAYSSPFQFKLGNNVSNSGKSNVGVQLSLEFITDAFADLQGSGPYSGGFFLPNWGSANAELRGLEIWLERNNVQVTLFPCVVPDVGLEITESF